MGSNKINIQLKLKNIIRHLISKNKTLNRFSVNLYLRIFHFSEREVKKSFGSLNEDKVFYVIRSRNNGVDGLMSILKEVLKRLEYSERNGWIPYVDINRSFYKYTDTDKNIWNYYFTQPSTINYKEIYSSKKVIFSGYISVGQKPSLFDGYKYDEKTISESYNFLFKHIDFNSSIYESVREEKENIPVKDCLGVYLRGTDYVKLKPTGHPIQPDLEIFISKIYEFLNKHAIKRIFLVTEDHEIYLKLKEEFGDRLIITSFDTFIENYDGSNYLSKSNIIRQDKFSDGLHYLVKLILLSECNYLVSSLTNGSKMAMVFNGNKYSDKYIFDSGMYP